MTFFRTTPSRSPGSPLRAQARASAKSVGLAGPLLVVAALALPWLAACEPRSEGRPPATAGTTPTGTYTPGPGTAPTPAPTPYPTTPTGPTTAPTPGLLGIPGLGLGLPTSPRAALVGRWRITSINGKSVPASAGGIGGADPMDPATYVAGSTVEFTASQAKVTKGGVNIYDKPTKCSAKRRRCGSRSTRGAGRPTWTSRSMAAASGR